MMKFTWRNNIGDLTAWNSAQVEEVDEMKEYEDFLIGDQEKCDWDLNEDEISTFQHTLLSKDWSILTKDQLQSVSNWLELGNWTGMDWSYMVQFGSICYMRCKQLVVVAVVLFQGEKPD